MNSATFCECEQLMSRHERRADNTSAGAEAPSVNDPPPAGGEHPLQRQIADALRLELAPPGKVSRAGVVWWSIDHASYAVLSPACRTWLSCISCDYIYSIYSNPGGSVSVSARRESNRKIVEQ
jgi:hypothetical protein